MLKMFDWRCDLCGNIQEHLTRDGSRPERVACDGCKQLPEWRRLPPGTATTFRFAGRYIPPRRG